MTFFFGKDEKYRTFFFMVALSLDGFVIALGWLVLSIAWSKEKTA
jgi:hypothetical protein